MSSVFDVLTVGSPLHDARALRGALEPSLRALASLGGREAGEAALTAADPLAVLVGTGGTEAEILRLHATRQASAPGDPLPGAVTLLRLGGRGLEPVFIAEGQAVPASPREDLCRTQVDVALAPAEVAEILARPLGNHLVLVQGTGRSPPRPKARRLRPPCRP